MSVRMLRATLLFIAATAPIGLGAAQEAGPAAPEPVRLDAVVTGPDGAPVEDLQPGDVEVRDDGEVQTLSDLEFVSPRRAAGAGTTPVIASGRDERESAGRPGTRLVGILLDEFHVAPEHTARVREAVGRFLDEQLRPEDLVVILKPLDSLADIRLSRDREELERQVRTFEGRRGDYEPRTSFEKTYMSRAPATAGPQRAQVVVSALAALAVHLGELSAGRKSLVFVSEGFGRVPRRGRLRGAGLQTIVRSADRFGVAIYSIDPGGGDGNGGAGSTAGEGAGRDMLRTLAEQTGGRSVGAGELEGGLAAAARDLDGYYLIGYRPAREPDGRRHDIEVRVNRPGVQVRTRAGRWATRPLPALRPAAGGPAIPGTTLPRRAQQISPFIRPWFGTSRGSDGNTRLTFTWEPNTRAKPAPDSLTLSAVGADGRVLFEGRVEPIRAIGVHSRPALRAVFEAPPGLVQLDMTIRGADGRTLGTDVRDVKLPDLSGSRPALSTPEIIRTRSALQFRTLAADPAAPPVVSRSFSRAERLLVRVHAYGAGDRPPQVSAQLVSRRNQTLRRLRALSEAPAADMTQFDLPLSSLAVGEYGIEIRADDVRELVLFEVTD